MAAVGVQKAYARYKCDGNTCQNFLEPARGRAHIMVAAIFLLKMTQSANCHLKSIRVSYGENKPFF